MNNIAVYPPTIHGLERAKQGVWIFITIAWASFTYLLVVSVSRYTAQPKSAAPRSCSR